MRCERAAVLARISDDHRRRQVRREIGILAIDLFTLESADWCYELARRVSHNLETLPDSGRLAKMREYRRQH